MSEQFDSGTSRLPYGRQAKHPDEFKANVDEFEIFHPGYVLGYYRRLETILDACPVNIYAASSLKHPWPYRLQNAAECYPASFWRSPCRLLDSAITAPELTNQDVLDHAVKRHATAVAAKDYLPFDAYDSMELTAEQDRAVDGLRSDYKSNVEATTASIQKFAEIYDPEIHPPAYIPLQPPYHEHVREVAPIVEASHLEHRYMLGGLKDASPKRRIEELLAFRAEVGPNPVAHVRVSNVPDEYTFYPGEFSPSKHKNTYRAIRGEVSKATDVKPKIEDAAFECQRCGTLNYVPQAGGQFQEPHECQGCERQGPFRIDFDQSEFVDGQKLRLQTPPGMAGGAGQHIDVYVEDDLTGVAQTGDSVTISGRLRLDDSSSGSKEKSRTFDQHLVGECIEFDENDPTEETITAEERAEIEAIADGKLGDPVTVAGESLAPKIFGHQTEKEALILAAVGGARHTFTAGEERGNFHVLLIGDPGTSKSKLGNRPAKISPRAVSVDAAESGKAGLTAAAVQSDFAEGETWTLDAGAAVMADDDVLWVDELDDMEPKKRASLTTPMSEQKIEVSKAGINATLATRCAVVAAANPKYSRFDAYESIGEQIDLEGNLLSRFDLIFVLTDQPEKGKDTKIADHQLHARDLEKRKKRGMEVDEDVAEETEPRVEEDLLQKWIVLARQQPDPVFEDPSVHNQLRDAFVQLRGVYGYEEDTPVPVTHRKLPGIVRVAEAVAKLHLSDVITADHAREACEKVRDSMKQFGRDEDGNLDADVVEVGRSKSQQQLMKLIRKGIIEFSADYDDGVPREVIIEEWLDGSDADRAHHAMDKMLNEGSAIEPAPDHIRYIGRP